MNELINKQRNSLTVVGKWGTISCEGRICPFIAVVYTPHPSTRQWLTITSGFVNY